MDVSIIIVSYNTCSLLCDCIASVKALTKGCSYEIIVVDNASCDGSVEKVRSMFPDVTVIASSVNLGFGRANNLGVSHSCGDYLFLLNSDTVLLSDTVTFLHEYMLKNADVYTAGCSLVKEDGCSPNISFGTFPSASMEIQYLWSRLFRKSPGVVDMSVPFDVDFVSGADMMIPRSVFERSGGFDESFFLYYEETDLQKRFAAENGRRVIVPGEKIIHLEGGSFASGGLSYNRFMNSQHSYNRYVSKHFSGLGYVWMRFIICILRLTVFFMADWNWRERLSAYRCVIKGEK